MNRYLEKLATVIIDHSTKVQEGETVLIDGPVNASEILEELYRQVIERGAYPVLDVNLPGTREYLLNHGTDNQLSYIPVGTEDRISTAQVTISILSETNIYALSNIPPDKYARYLQSRRFLKNIRYERAAEGELRWCLAMYPTDAYAQQMCMSLSELWSIFGKSCFLDMDDPIEGWESIHELNNRVEAVLSNTDIVRIVAENTDLTMSIKDRLFDNCYGQVNIPDGEVATAPIEDSVNGHVLFTYPFFNDGKQIDRINLFFENGKAVQATAATNEKYLNEMLDVDEGARYLGELGFGTNYNIPRFMGNLFFDEKLGGTLHLALGNAYPAEGGTNVSTIHWDIVLDLRNNAQVYTDGKLFIENGEFIF